MPNFAIQSQESNISKRYDAFSFNQNDWSTAYYILRGTVARHISKIQRYETKELFVGQIEQFEHIC